jgi:ClpP class serine protease
MKKSNPIYLKVLEEQNQGSGTRCHVIKKIEKIIGNPVITFFTSFNYPVTIENRDADMIEGVLQKIDTTKGLSLIINSPGGSGLAAERIINICKSYSKTGNFSVLVPSKAKSAATMICFGANKIYMGPASELGPIDPQMTIINEKGSKRFSLWNVVQSYNKLFDEAIKTKKNIQPYLQQLSHYDPREIKEFKDAISLSEDIAIKALHNDMLHSEPIKKIKKGIKIFLSPEEKKAHGRPIYRDEAENCGLNIEKIKIKDKLWEHLCEIYIRTNNFVSTKVSKCIESNKHSFIVPIPRSKNK